MEQYRAALGSKEVRCAYGRIHRTEKKGGLRSLVSKFENLSSSSKRINAGGGIHRELNGTGKLKGRSWRGVVGFKKNEKELQDDRSRSTHDNDPGEIEGTAKADGKKIKLCEESEDEKSVKSEDIPIVRGKKEGRKWLGGFGMKLEDKGTETPESVGGDHKTKIDIDMKLQSKSIPLPSEVRRESVVQMRIRMLEEAERPKQPRPVLNPKEIACNRVGSNSNGSVITPKATHAETSRGGTTGTERTGLPRTSQLSVEPSKSLGLERVAAISIHPSVSSITQPDSSPNVPTRVSPQIPAEGKTEVSPERGPQAARERRLGHPSEAQTLSLAARPEREAPPRRVAPTIRDRIHMFEAAKDNKAKGVAALFGVGASAALKRRINEEEQELEKERSRVVDEQQAEVEEPEPKIDASKRTQSAVNKYLGERKKSSASTQRSSDGKVDGKYVSAFAGWRRAKEGSNASSQTNSTASRDVKGTASKDKLLIPAQRKPISCPTTAAPGYVGPQATQQPWCSSAQQSSSQGGSGAHSEPLSDQSFGAFQDPLSPLTADTLPGTVDHRVAGIVDMLSEDDQRIIPRGVANGFVDIERVGRTKGVVWDESSEDEAGEETPLIVQSLVPLTEPKPLRQAEVNRMLKMCRLGRGRSEERGKGERGE